MRKINFILLFIIVSLSNFAVEFNGEIDAERKSANNAETEYNISAKFTAQYQENNMSSEITVSADTRDEEQELEIYRAYTELYKDNFTLSLGRQKIVWGNAFLFNMADVINTPDPSDPRGDKKGVDSLRLKYSTDNMSRLELVEFNNNADGNNLAFRYTTLVKNYEIMLNYFDYKTVFNNITTDINTVVLEFKGDAIVGIWSQLVFQNINEDDYNYLVLGSDYSFEINENILYLLGEGIYNENQNIGLLYLRYSYAFSEDISFGQSCVFTPEEKAGILYNNFEYLFNDYVTISIGINQYYNIDSFSGFQGIMFDEDLKSEAKFKISSYF